MYYSVESRGVVLYNLFMCCIVYCIAYLCFLIVSGIVIAVDYFTVSFWPRADKIPPALYSTYRQACSTAGQKQPEGVVLIRAHLCFPNHETLLVEP